MRARPRAWHAGTGSLPGPRTALAWPLLCWTLAVPPAACAHAPAPRIEVACQESYTVHDPRPIPRIEHARPITIEFLNQEYGPLPPCVLRVLEPLLETGTARIKEEHEDDPRFSERTWKIAVGEEAYEVKEKLFEGEPIRFSVSGRFYFDPLNYRTSSTPLCLTFDIGSFEHRAVLFTCDAATVERVEMAIRTRTFYKDEDGLRLIRDESGELIPLNRPNGVAGGIMGGCIDCLHLTFADAFVYTADISRDSDGMGLVHGEYNDAIVGILEEIARRRGVTLHWRR
jgi:hypothetical protein